MDDKPLLDRPANPLCTRCGLCCIMLSAHVTEDEASVIAEENGLDTKKFCHKEAKGEGPNVGKLVLNMPCRFLLGRPTSHTGCRIYAKTRPSVCETYLCRVAMQYKTGVFSLEQAHQVLKKAFATGDAGLFNWIGLKGETALRSSMVIKPLREEAAKMVTEFGENGHIGILDERAVGDILIAKAITPTYLVHSDMAHLELNLLLNFFDKGTHELKDVVPQHLVDKMTEEERELAFNVYDGLLKKLRGLFKTTDELKEEKTCAEEPSVS